MIDVKMIPLCSYVARLKTNHYFSFPRYGDGEWRVMVKGCGAVACGFQIVNPKMQADMIRSLVAHAGEPNIVFGIQNHAVRTYGHRIPPFLETHRLEGISWVEADTFHYASRDGLLYPLIEQLRKMKVVVVGPNLLRKLASQTFDYVRFVQVRAKNCYIDQPTIKSKILQIHNELKQNTVYSFCCGPLAEPLIQDLHLQMPGNFLIDFGSVWDVFCGARTRGYTMKKSRYTKEILERNLGLKG